MTIFRARVIVLIAVLSVWPLSLHAQGDPGYGRRGPLGQFGQFGQFSRYPFDQWAVENAKPQIRWNVRVDPAKLSPHQRLMAQIHVNVDGAELQKRQNDGQIVMFARIEDSAGHRYQSGNQTSISRLHQGGVFRELDWSISVFVLPGDYVISLAVCDGKTLEHSFIRRNLHVAGINQDPLPNAWKDLPPVEFVPVNGNPDAWFLPQVRSRLALPVETPVELPVELPVEKRRPVHVELLVNTTPAAPGTLNAFRQNMELVVPSMKVLMGIAPSGGIGLSVVDLNRRASTYEEPDLRAMARPDWLRSNLTKLRAAFAESRNATVDIKSLAGQRKMLDYLAVEANRRLGTPGSTEDTARVLIVLSAPFYFTDQDQPPAPELPPDPSRRVFYIRYSPLAILMLNNPTPDSARFRVPLYPFSDDIERVLRPMGARVFRASKPEEFRKALGTILDEIGKMQASR